MWPNKEASGLLLILQSAYSGLLLILMSYSETIVLAIGMTQLRSLLDYVRLGIQPSLGTPVLCTLSLAKNPQVSFSLIYSITYLGDAL